MQAVLGPHAFVNELARSPQIYDERVVSFGDRAHVFVVDRGAPTDEVENGGVADVGPGPQDDVCLLYTSPSPRDS